MGEKTVLLTKQKAQRAVMSVVQQAAARVSQCLQDAEIRAAIAEDENMRLSQVLKDSHFLATNLTEQLQVLKNQLETSARQCRQLKETFVEEEKTLQTEEERKKSMANLLSHIAQLETQLVCAAHFSQNSGSEETLPTIEGE